MRQYISLYIAVGPSGVLHAVLQKVGSDERRSLSKPEAFTDEHFSDKLAQGTVIDVADNDDAHLPNCNRVLKLHPVPCGQPTK